MQFMTFNYLLILLYFLSSIVARRKTIYEYHRVNFSGDDIKNNTVIRMVALPTCLEYKDCAVCLDTNLEAFNVSDYR